MGCQCGPTPRVFAGPVTPAFVVAAALCTAVSGARGPGWASSGRAGSGEMAAIGGAVRVGDVPSEGPAVEQPPPGRRRRPSRPW
ncbi:hypothetical protein B0H10DRAFT_2051995 [Mycena sp. CBHHK59/15]|nr:hypothetical protein B0H10DRAFT_2051995 [Mycena sp. CBHHK59/15]